MDPKRNWRYPLNVRLIRSMILFVLLLALPPDGSANGQNEPATATLRDVRFPGAGWGNAAAIREQLKQLEPVAFDRGTTLTTELLAHIEDVTTQLMRSHGYLDAKVDLTENEPTSKGARVTYRIERGHRYHIGTIRVEGIRNPEANYWEPATERFDTKPLTSERLRDLEQSIKELPQTEGYMAAETALEFAPGPKEYRVDINAKVDEGTTSSLGAIRIEREAPERDYGSSWYHRTIAPPTADSIIRRQIRTRIGEPLNRNVLDDASRRLWSLGTLDKVEVETEATSIGLVRDLVAKIRDRRTAAFGASVGWAPEIGPIGRLTFSEQNLGGRADALTLGLSLNRAGPGGEISYLDRNWKSGERWLGEEREPSLLYAVYLNSRNYNEYSEQRVGGRLRLGYLIGEATGPWSNSWEARLERIGYEPYRHSEDYTEKFNDYLAATIAYRLTRDTRDRGEWDATRGTLFETALEIGAADGPLIKSTSWMEWRYALARRWIWLTQGEIGLMPLSATDIGLSDRFQAGGDHGVRGFRDRGIGPVDDRNDNLHIGGATKLILRNELRFLMNDRVQFPLFLDIGSLEREAFRLGTPRASVGLGVRFIMPGSSQKGYFTVAQNLVREKTDDSLTFRFGFSIDF